MTVSLDFIAEQLQRVLDEQRRMRGDIAELRTEVAAVRKDLSELRTQHGEELTVLTGMVMRYAGEHIAWGGMERQIARLTTRVEALEGRRPE